MHGKKKLTIADIAEKAGVSKATVSRILNGKPDVSAETRERVFRLIEEAQYVPSASATRLTRGTSNLIGLLIPSLEWPWVLQVINGITSYIEQTDYELVLLTATTPERTQKLFHKTVGSGFADGLIAMLPPHAASYIHDIYDSGFPLVVIDDRDVHEKEFPLISIDNIHSAYRATRYLIDLGHKRIGFISGPDSLLCSRERYDGYCQALENANLPLDERIVSNGDFTQIGGYNAACSLLDVSPRPSAIFAANDLMAFGVMEATNERKLRVPNDVALVGFDDIPEAQVIEPALTTVHQPMIEAGKAAAELIIAQINNQPVTETRIKLDTDFIIRQSSGGRVSG